MKRRVELRPGVAEEVAEASAWYETQRPELGVRFIDTVDALLGEIASSPALGSISPLDTITRRRLLPRFPYVVFYRFADDAVTVLAVAHAKRKPGYWTDR